MAEKSTINIKKIKKAAHSAHGGAWKVAYADFVTAMMAFFLLLWLLSSQPQEKLKGIADYFTPTLGVAELRGLGLKDGTRPNAENSKDSKVGSSAIIFGSEYKGTIIKLPETAKKRLEQIDAKNFSSIQHDLYKAVHDNPESDEPKDRVSITETPEGLKIDLLDDVNKPMFYPGSYELQPYIKTLLTKLAPLLKFMPNYIAVNGHTSRLPIENPNNDDNWELSAKRANVVRKFFDDGGFLDTEQIIRIVGKADQEPLDEAHPDDLKNVRLSLILLRNTLIPFNKQASPDLGKAGDQGADNNN